MATEGTSGHLEEQFDAWLALAAGGAAPAAVGSPRLLRLPMLTGSMHPALPRGCTLLIAPLARGPAAGGRGAPSTGDVVVFARDGRLVAHRVLRRAQRGGRTWLLEMGDANRRGAWRPVDEAVGLVVGAEAADGAPLRPPVSRARARRLLVRHWVAVLRGLAAPNVNDEPTPTGAP
ncbi:MAG: S24/S26 family peptidase [bacterium]|nr:S24/S26 family peptidase [bacterium]